MKKAVLIVISVPTSLALVFYITDVYLEILQHELIETNFPKIRIGMTSAQVEAALGWPDAIYLNAEDKSVHLPKSQFSSWFRTYYSYSSKMTDYQNTPINTQDREVWIYQYDESSPPYEPAIIFDIKTKKVIQLTKVYYGE